LNLVLELTWCSSLQWTLETLKPWTLTWLQWFLLLLHRSLPLLLFLPLVRIYSLVSFLLLLWLILWPLPTPLLLSLCLSWLLPFLLFMGCYSFVKHSTRNLFKIIKHQFLVLEDADETLLVRPGFFVDCSFSYSLVYIACADMSMFILNLTFLSWKQ